ncbi:MAG: hypothetical protein AVO35_07290 [Candidatus Aegiribacteria sp. MLS_C]|nr:MAG: hypothetical protein AVO35_07290 [Candidatus Aegiribacteria sp. MLS_C]
MTLFPSSFRDPADISRLLYYTAIWSGGRTSEVRVDGFDTLRTHVNEISRSPSSGRVAGLSKYMNLLPGISRSTIHLPPDIASGFFGACLREASALLELGYPRDEPAVFTTSFPAPGANSIRTVRQIRSALHHLGGDFDLFRALVRTSHTVEGALEVSFSIWPPRRVRDGSFVLRLGHRGQSVPAVLIMERRLLGYALLCCWDLALRLREAEKVQVPDPDFNTFAGRFMESDTRG